MDYSNEYSIAYKTFLQWKNCYNLTSFDAHAYLCLVHFIWTERRISKLVLNVKCLLLLSFLTVAEFYNLGHIQGIIRVH